VVLFGATGLTGAHILKYLLKSGTKRVLCVVRGHTAEGGKCRIIRAMQDMKIWKPAFEDAIEVVIGDMAKPRLGLTPEVYQQLATDTRTIVHAAGDRTWLISQDSSECNQTGLMSIVALARESGASIHYVSSCWVDIYERVDNEDKAEISKLPYVGLKREGEDILSFAAWQHGVDCYSYRVPVLGPNRHGGFSGELGPLNCVQLMMYYEHERWLCHNVADHAGGQGGEVHGAAHGPQQAGPAAGQEQVQADDPHGAAPVRGGHHGDDVRHGGPPAAWPTPDPPHGIAGGCGEGPDGKVPRGREALCRRHYGPLHQDRDRVEALQPSLHAAPEGHGGHEGERTSRGGPASHLQHGPYVFALTGRAGEGAAVVRQGRRSCVGAHGALHQGEHARDSAPCRQRDRAGGWGSG
jgi:nucleoside-diphosphate-sugar epimerase